MRRDRAQPTVGNFLSSVWSDWGARVSGALSVPFVYLGLFAKAGYTRIIYTCLALIGVLITIFQVWAKERKKVLALNEQCIALKEQFTAIGGPELFIGYGYVPVGSTHPLIVVANNKGMVAYNVTLKIPRDGSKVQSKIINILRDDAETRSIPFGEKNRLDVADIIMAQAQQLPVILTCTDADCREFVYVFEPPEKHGSGFGFRLIDKHCVGRTRQTLPVPHT